MKATAQKLKQFKPRQVYGFKKETANDLARIDPTLTTSLTCGMLANVRVHAQV